MNRRLVAIGGLLLLMVLFVSTVLVTRQPSQTPQQVCEELIHYVQQGEAQKSYDLFTPSAQNTMTQNDWQKQVATLKNVFGQKTQPKLASKAGELNGTTGGTTQQSQFSYTIKNHGATYALTCFMTQTDKHVQINAFSSELQS